MSISSQLTPLTRTSTPMRAIWFAKSAARAWRTESLAAYMSSKEARMPSFSSTPSAPGAHPPCSRIRAASSKSQETRMSGELQGMPSPTL